MGINSISSEKTGDSKSGFKVVRYYLGQPKRENLLEAIRILDSSKSQIQKKLKGLQTLQPSRTVGHVDWYRKNSYRKKTSNLVEQ